MKKKLSLLVIVLATILVVSTVSASATESGICGDNLTWTLDDDILIINGSGAMYNYNNNNAPWYDIRNSVKQVIISEGVSHIGDFAFYSFSNLMYVKLQKGVVSIGERAFHSCSNLTRISIPEGVTNIGDGAFYFCKNLKEITIPSSMENIGEYAFASCWSLSKIYYAGTEDDWNNINIANYNNYLTDASVYYETIDDRDGILDSGECGDNLIWELNMEGKLTISGTGAMTNYNYSSSVPWNDYCSNITTVEIQEGVTTVADYVFWNCSKLSNVVIGKNINSISKNAFHNCTSLTSVDVDSDNKYFSSDSGILFDKSKSLLIMYPEGKVDSRYLIPNSVINIDSDAFYNCTSLTNVTIPNSVTSIGESAFAGCSKLNDINIPSSVTNIGGSAFGNCVELSSIKIPGSVSSIEGHMFSNCINLSNIEFENGIKEIDWFAFEYCVNLKIVKIPKSLERIGYMAFGGAGLTDIYYEGSEDEWEAISIAYVDYRSLTDMVHYNAIGINPPIITATTAISSNLGSSLSVGLSNTEYDSTLITAFYKDGVLIDLETTLISAGDTNEEISIPDNIDADEVKSFIWSSLESMKPLCEAKSIKF